MGVVIEVEMETRPHMVLARVLDEQSVLLEPGADTCVSNHISYYSLSNSCVPNNL